MVLISLMSASGQLFRELSRQSFPRSMQTRRSRILGAAKGVCDLPQSKALPRCQAQDFLIPVTKATKRAEKLA